MTQTPATAAAVTQTNSLKGVYPLIYRWKSCHINKATAKEQLQTTTTIATTKVIKNTLLVVV